MNSLPPHLVARPAPVSRGVLHRLRTIGTLPAAILRNVWCARRLRSFPVARFGEFRVEPLAAGTLVAMARLYERLNHRPFAPDKRLLLAMLGSKLALVVRNEASGKVVGLAYYYFNARDRMEGTIHVGYSGVAEDVRGCGLGTFMRRHALANFAASGLGGVSSRISASNGASRRVNEKLGFIIVETYFDDELKELRHYMVCDLNKLRNKFPNGTNQD
ncbi:MAG TPA: GNAT family N-acetyltransferase [Noviherbaspirillum sp.]|nr:GNAT family N-acetyltransferase [Noviherbaspirillum sp.]